MPPSPNSPAESSIEETAAEASETSEDASILNEEPERSSEEPAPSEPVLGRREQKLLENLRRIPGWEEGSIDIQGVEGRSRQFLVTREEKQYLARLYGHGGRSGRGPAPDRSQEFHCQDSAAQAGVAPKRIAQDDQSFAIEDLVEGATLEPSTVVGSEVFPKVIEAIRTMHRQCEFEGEFWPFSVIRLEKRRALKKGAKFPRSIPEMYAALDRIENLVAPSSEPCACHNELDAKNFVYDGTKVWINHWNQAATGDRYYDLANFSVFAALDQEKRREMLKLYFESSDEKHFHLLTLWEQVARIRFTFKGLLLDRISRQADRNFKGEALQFFEDYFEKQSGDEVQRAIQALSTQSSES